MHPLDPVVLTVDIDRAAAVDAPDAADDRDRLLERLDRLAGRSPGSAGGDDGVPEGAGTEAELGATVAEDVERRDRLGEHGGGPQRQVGDVRRDPHGRRTRGDRGQQGPGVQVLGLVRVVLDGDQVVAEYVGQLRKLERARCGGGVGGEEDAELQVMAVVGHASNLEVSTRSTGVGRGALTEG